jgi:TolA-binding protein
MVGATPEILREAKYLRASSLIKLSKPEEALADLKELALNTKSVEGAEAKFRLAEIYFNRQDYTGAEKEVFNYIENGTPHQYWLARSFVLLADIYHLQGDDFQARQYLESLQENYNGEDDIDDMINARFNEWQMVQGSSSLPDDNMVVESDPVTE